MGEEWVGELCQENYGLFPHFVTFFLKKKMIYVQSNEFFMIWFSESYLTYWQKGIFENQKYVKGKGLWKNRYVLGLYYHKKVP